MPHLMCRACRLRFHRPVDVPLDGPLDSEPCPHCGEPLASVQNLRQLIGFRAADDIDEDRAPRPAKRVPARSGSEALDVEWGTLRVRAAQLPVPEPPR
jgi:hypothetical protein